MGPEALAQVLSPLDGLFTGESQPGLLVGLGIADDAAVFRVNARTAVVATLDFFAPLVDEPYTYGAIAAANAMSDVYAMGGEVALALNIAAFPRQMPPETVTAILRGGAEKVAEAGGVIAGGHTIWDEEPKYGLSVLGLVNPRRLLSKPGLKPGDVLYLTKPLGTGAILTAGRKHEAARPWVEAAIESMLRLNRHSSHLARQARLAAATDVTGFGLLGHLWEMSERSGVAAEVGIASVPLLPGAVAAIELGAHTGGEERNRDWLTRRVTIEGIVDQRTLALLYDPQTSGGLLLGCPRRRAPALEAAFARDGEPLWRIGRVVEGPPRITVSAARNRSSV